MSHESRRDERRPAGEGRPPSRGPDETGLPGDLVADVLEPHESLRYVARLFKALALLLLILLVAEVAMGLVQQGDAALPVLLVEATRLLVFAGVLWGLGDIALMLIESNHDLRASRVLLWRIDAMMARKLEEDGVPVETLVRPPGEGSGRRG